MLRMGRNPKEDKDATADHTPQQPAAPAAPPAYGSGASGSPAPGAPGSVSDQYYQGAVHTPTTSRAVTESESLARDIKEGTLTGFVGNGTTLTGEANFKGMLRVDGHLSGRVSSQDGTLIISTNGQVDANIEVSVAQIYGTVNGDITASKRIEMGRVAKVTGNIQTPALVIEQGAVFEGSCRMAQIKETQEKQQPRVESAAGDNTASATSSSSSTTSSAKSGGTASGLTSGSAVGESGGSSSSSEVADLTDSATAS